MKISNKLSVATIAVSVALGLAGPLTALAATTPSLGQATSYGVLGSTYSNATGPTTITGDVGFTTGPAVTPLGVHANYGSGAPYSTAGTDQGTAWSNLNDQFLANCTSLGAAVNLDNVVGHTTGIYTPGCYSSTGAMNITTGQTVTLNGAGTYIFRPTGALTPEANTFVTLSGDASACDVFWIPTAATTLGAVTAFKGTVIDDAGITIGDAVSWIGRALGFASTITTPNTNASITVPSTCSTAPSSGGRGPRSGNINVVKVVVNDSGGTKVVADFPLFVNGSLVVSGVTNSFPAPALAYTVTETGNANYVQSFSGGCDSDGHIALSPGDNRFCIITNNDIGAPVIPPVPPLIDVVKVPSPLALPNGPGLVKYTYTLRNIGTVPMTNITMVGDSCSPIVLVSGDTNGDNKLQVNETWVHTCSTTLQSTHTNTVVATGWANGISAVDIASATVVVGLPVVPPIIHITKVPSPLTLRAGGGVITYTKKVTNPGTVALSNVRVTDDKCSPVKYISGDTNIDSKLGTTETWTYTCKQNLTKTTTNTAIAEGDANGLTARDFAIATVVVAVPGFPNTGFTKSEPRTSWYTAIFSFLQGLRFF